MGKSDKREGEPPAKEKEAPKPGFKEWALKTAGAIIGGIGTTGAMVVIGSAVLWVRFKEAGIPENQAVAVQPRQEALVQGAQATIFFVLIALLVVAVLYTTDSHETGESGKAPAKPHEIGKLTIGVIVALPVLAILWAILATDLPCGSVLLLSLIAIGFAAGCVFMGLNDRKNFWALAGAVFVAVVAFAGAAGYLIVKDQKFVQAMAVLRGSEDAGLTGFYVAATDQALYIGQPAKERTPMYEVPRGDEVVYAVGPLEPQAKAEVRAKAMLEQLIANREGAGKAAHRTGASGHARSVLPAS